MRLVIDTFCDWLAATPVSEAFQNATWFVPLVQTVHILCIAVVLTSVYVLSFRLVGLTRGTQPLAVLTARSMPWIWTALAILLISGALLTITEPARELLNWAFRIKMLLVLVLMAILSVIQSGVRRNPSQWSESASSRRTARILGIGCLAVGAAIVVAGRWIAYV